MFEYVAYALLGLVMVGALLYVTISAETDEAPNPKGPGARSKEVDSTHSQGPPGRHA
jgi:hypothetical protein